ncbi:hypothetical protein V8E53_000204 [Lactarius tabidus]
MTFRFPRPEVGRGRGTVWHNTRTFSHACPHSRPRRCNTRMSAVRSKKETHRGAYFCVDEDASAPADAEDPHTIHAIDFSNHQVQSPIISRDAFDDLAGSFARIGSKFPKPSHPRCIDTALIFHHLCGRPLKPGLAWLARKWLGLTIQDRGLDGHNSENDMRACMDELKAKIKNGEFRADFEPILACIARSYSRNRGPNGRRMRTAIVDHGKPGALNSTSATAPTTAVACTHNVEVLDGLKGALDSQDRLYIWSWQMHRSINYN